MLDTDLVQLCAHCLTDAATHDDADAGLALSASALARDLADTHGADAAPMLHAASRLAIRWLDSSDLDGDSFAAALRRLARLRIRVIALLAACSDEACALRQIDRRAHP